MENNVVDLAPTLAVQAIFRNLAVENPEDQSVTQEEAQALIHTFAAVWKRDKTQDEMTDTEAIADYAMALAHSALGRDVFTQAYIKEMTS